jgi:RNA polymerase subunit RPABC4/transcription elongation factor Spt4
MADDTKKCYLCAEEIPLDTKICPYCGAQYEVVTKGYCTHDHEVVEANEKGMCPKCGRELTDKRTESRYVGEAEKPKITPVQPIHAPSPPPIAKIASARPARKRSGARPFLAIIGILGIAAVIYILVAGGHLPKPADLPISLPAAATATLTRTPKPTITSTPTATPTPLPVGAGYGSTSFEPGTACFGFLSFGLSCLDENGWHNYTPSNSALYGNSVYEVALCPNGDFAIAHDKGTVFYSAGTFRNPLSSRWGIESVKAIACDGENNLAVAYSGSLILSQQNAWKEIDISPLAPQEDPSERIVISDVLFDQSGALWVVGDWESVEGGIAKYENQNWIRFLEIPDMSEDINLHGLEEDSQGRIWAIYDDGLFSYDGQTWIHYPSPMGERIWDSFIDSDDRIWLTTSYGFASFFDGNWNYYEIENEGQSDDEPSGIALDARGRLWLPTDWGLTIFDGEQWTTYHMHDSDIASNDANSLAIQAGGPSLPTLIEKESGSISGRIFLNGQPLVEANVEVCIKSLGMFYTGNTPCGNQPYIVRGKTDEEGRFTLTVFPGHYYLVFKGKDAEKWTRLTSGITGLTSMRIDVLPGKDSRLNDIYQTE